MRRIAFAACLVVAACGDNPTAPTPPPQPTYPQVAGSYAGSATLTLPELDVSMSCPGTTVVTQTGNTVNIAPILLGGACPDDGGVENVPLGTVTIGTNGAFPDETGIVTADCGEYDYVGSGGFFGQELRVSFSATSSTCANFTVTAVLLR